jgi:hypothetical protein
METSSNLFSNNLCYSVFRPSQMMNIEFVTGMHIRAFVKVAQVCLMIRGAQEILE